MLHYEAGAPSQTGFPSPGNLLPTEDRIAPHLGIQIRSDPSHPKTTSPQYLCATWGASPTAGPHRSFPAAAPNEEVPDLMTVEKNSFRVCGCANDAVCRCRASITHTRELFVYGFNDFPALPSATALPGPQRIRQRPFLHLIHRSSFSCLKDTITQLLCRAVWSSLHHVRQLRGLCTQPHGLA